MSRALGRMQQPRRVQGARRLKNHAAPVLVSLLFGGGAGASEPTPEPQWGAVVTTTRLAEAARPDTERRLTGAELAERGVTDLGQALDLLLDTPVRGSGRQVAQVNVRGARKGAVLVLLDGLPVGDPHHGNFDVAAVPVTDIAEIRVALTPASPLDGVGGSGGVIEVLTRAAVGRKDLRAQVQAGTGPSVQGAVGGRAPVLGAGVRASVTGAWSGRDLDARSPTDEPLRIDADSRAGTAALRVERAFGASRWTLEAAATQRSYRIPPAERPLSLVSTVPEDRTLRAVAGFDNRAGRTRTSLRLYTLQVHRDGVRFEDATLSAVSTRERVRSYRSGGYAQVDQPLGSRVRTTAVLHFLVEGGEETVSVPDAGATRAEGTSPVVQPAVGATWRVSDALSVDAAAGLTAPLGEARGPAWPEAKLHAGLEPVDWLGLRLTLARKGRLPSLRDRFSPEQGNPAVRPEMASSADASVRLRPHERVDLELSAFVRKVDDLIRNAPVSGDTGPQRGLEPVSNFGEVRLYGGEARLDLRIHPRLTVDPAYAYIQADSVRLGAEPLDFLPAHRADLGVTARPLDALGLRARLRFVSEQLDAGERLLAHSTLDAWAWYNLGAARVSLRGENLTDQRYLARAAVQAEGRTLFLGMEATWK